MPRWLTDILVVVLAAGGIYFSGWLRDRLRLTNWHLLAILVSGILIYAVGIENSFFPVIIAGVIVFLFPCGAWSQRGLRALAAKRKSN
jgi:hypothetical protein